MQIKVLGTGCRKCKALLAATEEAVKSTGVQAEIEYVTDMMQIAETGLLSTPGLIIDNQIVSSGKVLEPQAIVELIEINKCMWKTVKKTCGISHGSFLFVS
ncbi:thioredoxin family protein [Acinetobacter sp. LH3_13]|uniref:thioredoxin family protein n=1 Tax=Acinetobacter sp. LH3_13 TaxID=3434463 RepID=UPI003EC14566